MNKLILGTVQFGMNYGVNNNDGKPEQSKVEEMLAFAHASGITSLDTAEAYGNAHEVIGNYHKTHGVPYFNIISKLPHSLNLNIEKRIESYLAELNIKKFAGILFHSFDTYNNNKDAVGRLSSLKIAGIVENVGVSIYTNEQAEIVIKDERIDIIQLPYNLLDNLSLRGDVLRRAKESGKIIHTRSTFLQGLFLLHESSGNNPFNQLKAELARLRELSESYQISIEKLALCYCLQQPLIDNVLIGVDNINQLRQNVQDSYFILPDELIAEIDQISVKNIDLLNPSLWN